MLHRYCYKQVNLWESPWQTVSQHSIFAKSETFKMKNINPGAIILMCPRLCLTYPESVSLFMLLQVFNTPGRNAGRKLWAKVI